MYEWDLCAEHEGIQIKNRSFARWFESCQRSCRGQ